MLPFHFLWAKKHVREMWGQRKNCSNVSWSLKKTLEIHCIIKKLVTNLAVYSDWLDKEKIWKYLTLNEWKSRWKLRYASTHLRGLSSLKLLRPQICLKHNLEMCTKLIVYSHLKSNHFINHVKWTKKMMWSWISAIHRWEYDGLGSWQNGWCLKEVAQPVQLSHKQNGGGFMFWSELIDNEFIGPWKVDNVIKITSICIQLLKANFRYSLRRRMKKLFKNNHIVWSPLFLDLNTIDNLWRIAIEFKL